MKVFISWSGELSKKVAEVLKPWIKCVLQATEPFLSSEDIDKGSMWFTDLSDQLADTGVGIICLTAENMNAPWILFEAGSLAKGLSKNRVCTFLVDISNADLKGPLSHFQATTVTKEDMFRLINTINNSLEPNRLPEEILRITFDQFWGNVSAKLRAVLEAHKPAKRPRRPQEEMTEEILEISRSMQRTLQEKNFSNFPMLSGGPIDALKAYRDLITRETGEKSSGESMAMNRAFLRGVAEATKRRKEEAAEGLTTEPGLIDTYVVQLDHIATKAQNGSDIGTEVSEVVQKAADHFAALETSSELGNLRAFRGQLGIRAMATHPSMPKYRDTLERAEMMVGEIIRKCEAKGS